MNPDRRTAWIIRGYLLDGVMDADRLTDTLSSIESAALDLCCLIDSDGMMQPRDAAIPFEIVETDDDPWMRRSDTSGPRFEPFQLEHGKLFRLHIFPRQGTVGSSY